METPVSLPTERLINELQTFGVRLADPKAGLESRRGGAGPSDHKALTIDGVTVMAPVHTAPAFESPYVIDAPDAQGRSRIARDGKALGEAAFVMRPRFYDLTTADGVPYSTIAVLHGRDVLATTVLQSCIRYQSRLKACQFCAIGQSLRGRTHDRAQEPSSARQGGQGGGRTRWRQAHGDDDRHPARRRPRRRDPLRERRGGEGGGRSAHTGAMRAAGRGCVVRASQSGRRGRPRHAPRSRDARGSSAHHARQGRDFRRTVSQGFRRGGPGVRPGQVSTYILAGVGDPPEAILAICETLVDLGVYPFVVPFVPISGTSLESWPRPRPPSCTPCSGRLRGCSRLTA